MGNSISQVTNIIADTSPPYRLPQVGWGLEAVKLLEIWDFPNDGSAQLDRVVSKSAALPITTSIYLANITSCSQPELKRREL